MRLTTLSVLLASLSILAFVDSAPADDLVQLNDGIVAPAVVVAPSEDTPAVAPPSEAAPEPAEDPKDELDWDAEMICAACPCPRLYAPVCGSDKRTYPNKCMLRCAQLRCSRALGDYSLGHCVVEPWENNETQEDK